MPALVLSTGRTRQPTPDARFILLEATAAARLHSVCTTMVKTITECFLIEITRLKNLKT